MLSRTAALGGRISRNWYSIPTVAKVHGTALKMNKFSSSTSQFLRQQNLQRSFCSNLEDSAREKVNNQEELRFLVDLAKLDELADLKARFEKDPKNSQLLDEYIQSLKLSGFDYEAVMLLKRLLKEYRFRNPIYAFTIRRLLRHSKKQYDQNNYAGKDKLPINLYIRAYLIPIVVLLWLFKSSIKESFQNQLLDLQKELDKSEKESLKQIAEILRKVTKKEKTVPPPKVMFDDIIGIEEYKDEIVDIVKYLKNPSKYKKMGASVPKGILLAGPPGTGKTLLARALSNEAGCNYIYLSGSGTTTFFVGSGVAKIKETFKKARDNAPSILFIDEIDALAGDREHTFLVESLNQLLAEMDGFSSKDNVIVVGATNLPEKLDKAIMRPGRFDKTINVPLPDVKGREKLFKFYLDKVKVSEEIDYERLAKLTTRLSGADIANIANKSIIYAIRKGDQGCKNSHVDFILDQHMLGIRKKKMGSDLDLNKRNAYYEAGKAVMSLVYPGAEPVAKMTLLARGDIGSQVR